MATVLHLQGSRACAIEPHRGTVASVDPNTDLERLRTLQSALVAWRSARLIRRTRDPRAAEPALCDLGQLAHAFAGWLADRPERADEPLTRLAQDALEALYD